MYFPILRGRQNELLAVRELQQKGRLEFVTPIIEPVKASSTLLSVLTQFRDCEKEIVLVGDPVVGSFEKELGQNPKFKEEFEEVVKSSRKLIGMYYCNGSEVDILGDCCPRKAYYLHSENRDEYGAACAKGEPEYTLVPAGNQRIHRRARGRMIAVESAFQPQQRNADYCRHEEDFLTEELFYFGDDGFVGFSDYSVIGEVYSEGGFMPKVVALHLVHLSPERDQLFVRHFTSSEDMPGSNVAEKFYEALGGLLDWADTNEELLCSTIALQELRRIYDEERFPGLGVAKKLAIKHHLEMVNSLLGESR